MHDRNLRNYIYKNMLDFFTEDYILLNIHTKQTLGLCTALNRMGFTGIVDFPELIKYRPKYTEDFPFWFSIDKEWGHTIRVLILLQAIEDTNYQN